MAEPQNSAEQPVKGVWEDALSQLSDEKREIFDTILTKSQNYQQVLKSVLVATEEKKRECLKKRWKIVLGDRKIILRDVIDKIAVWARKFVLRKAVGDTLMQYDPGHAALPWAAIRFFLQVTVNDSRIYGIMLQSVEKIANLLSRCIIMEGLYLERDLKITKQFKGAVVVLYTAILNELANILGYFSHNTGSRLAKAVITNVDGLETSFAGIAEKQAEIEKLAVVAEAEKMQGVTEKVEDLRSSQQELDINLRQRHEGLLRLLKELLQPINRMDSGLAALEDNLEKKTRAKILKAISTIPYPMHHKAVAKDRLIGSGKWLLEKDLFLDWRTDSSSSVLWLHGIPGSGKSKLASLVIDELRSDAHLAFFYCMRNPAEPGRAECHTILSCLVRQLACISHNDPILDPVCQRYEAALDGFEGFESQAWSSDESTEVLIELTNMYPSVTFVIDALDEVNPMDRVMLLNKLTCIMNESTSLVKVFISSRDNIDIVMRLRGSPNLHIGAKENSHDIKEFVHQRLQSAELLHGRLSSNLQEKISKTLIEGAQGMFRWVDLQIQSLRPLKIAADIEARLGHLPETLEGSYWEIFEQIESSGENAAKLARFTFQWLLCAQTPIKIEDFAVLASVQSQGQEDAYDIADVRDVCANLITGSGPALGEDTSVFGFAHLSVREFLEGLSKRGIKYFRPAESNAAIASVCLAYLSKILQPSKIVEENIEVGKYTTNYWPYHVVQSLHFKDLQPLESQVKYFLVQDRKIATTFTRWCQKVAGLDDEANSELKDAIGQPPYNPLWLADRYSIIDMNKLDIADMAILEKVFVHAAGIGNCKVMKVLLEQGLQIIDVGGDAATSACRNGSLQALELLIQKDAPIQPVSLFLAILREDVGMVQLLCTNASKYFPKAQLSKALTAAVSSGFSSLFPVLLAHGAEKEPVAVVRALRAGTRQAANNLIDFGFEVHGQFLTEDRSALHWAAERGFEDTTKKLLEKNVAVDALDEASQTPLILVSIKGHSAIAKVLLQHGADISGRAIDGRTPLHYAVQMRQVEVIKVLREHGAEFEEKDLPEVLRLQLVQHSEGKTTRGVAGGKQTVNEQRDLSEDQLPLLPEYLPPTESLSRPLVVKIGEAATGDSCATGIPSLKLIEPTPPHSRRPSPSPKEPVGEEELFHTFEN